MARILDLITIGEKNIIVTEGDPSLDLGTSAQIGTIAIQDDGIIGNIWIKVGLGSNDWYSLAGEVKQPELIVLKQSDIDNKYIKLKKRPYNDLRLVNEEGLQQILGLDFRLNIDTIEWDGMHLDGQLEEGETLAVYY